MWWDNKLEHFTIDLYVFVNFLNIRKNLASLTIGFLLMSMKFIIKYRNTCSYAENK